MSASYRMSSSLCLECRPMLKVITEHDRRSIRGVLEGLIEERFNEIMASQTDELEDFED